MKVSKAELESPLDITHFMIREDLALGSEHVGQ
jgi:hypothetical protein